MIELWIAGRKSGGIEILLLKRGPDETYPGIWQMVSGRVNEGEKAFEGALREMEEETGLTPMNFWVVPNINSFYYPQEDAVHFLPVFLAEVDNNAKVQLSDEHVDFRWVPPDEAMKMVAWEGQRRSIGIINEYLSERESLLNFVKIEKNN